MDRIYTTFKRSCRNWSEFASAEKIIVDTDLTFEEARDACKDFNQNLTEEEIERGTKLEFIKSEDL